MSHAAGLGRWGFGILIAVALGLPSSAQAELFSYVDDNGVLHLTNVRPNANYKPYVEEDIEGFGGQKPVVMELPGGKKRVLYPVNVGRYDHIFRRAAKHYRLPFAFLKAVAKVESNFNPKAVSHADAKGMMQLIDSTAADMSVEDPFDPEQNIFGGARYLRVLANQFDGNMALVAAAYNSGPHRVKKLGRIPRIRETQRYVRRGAPDVPPLSESGIVTETAEPLEGKFALSGVTATDAPAQSKPKKRKRRGLVSDPRDSKKSRRARGRTETDAVHPPATKSANTEARTWSLREQAVALPNLVTYGRIAAIPVVMAVMQFDSRTNALIAAALFGLASASDALDGYLARRLNQTSLIGKFLDPLADKLLVLGCLVMLIQLERVSPWIVFVIVSREIVVTTLRTIAMGEGVVISARSLGKWKTVFQLASLGALLVHYDYSLGFVGLEQSLSFHAVGTVLLAASVVLSLASAGDYFLGFFRGLQVDADRGEDGAEA